MTYVSKISHHTAVSQVDWLQGLQQARQDFAKALKQQLPSSSANEAPAVTVAKSSPAGSAGNITAASSGQNGNVARDSVSSGASNVLKLDQIAPKTPADYGAMLMAQRLAAHPADPAPVPVSSADQLYARTLAPYGAQAWATAQGISGAPETWTAAQARDILGSSAPSLSYDPAKAVSLINARRASAWLALVRADQLTPLGTLV